MALLFSGGLVPPASEWLVAVGQLSLAEGVKLSKTLWTLPGLLGHLLGHTGLHRAVTAGPRVDEPGPALFVGCLSLALGTIEEMCHPCRVLLMLNKLRWLLLPWLSVGVAC